MKTIFAILCLIGSLTIQAQTVYVTKTGEKYHKENCHYLKQSKKSITLEKALEMGYKPCSVCKPAKTTKTDDSTKSNFSSSGSSSSSGSTKKATAAQCTAKTKAGKRCKRMTKNASGRCYQHE